MQKEGGINMLFTRKGKKQLFLNAILSYIWTYLQMLFYWNIEIPTKFQTLKKTRRSKLRKNSKEILKEHILKKYYLLVLID